MFRRKANWVKREQVGVKDLDRNNIKAERREGGEQV